VARLTASKSALALSPCLRWAGEGVQWFDDSVGDHSKRDLGTEVHHHLEQLVIKGSHCPAGISDAGAVLYDKASSWYVRNLRPEMDYLTPEKHFGHRLDATQERSFVLPGPRQYPQLDGTWIHGTADLFGRFNDGRIYIGDWKTGGGSGAREQLMTLAMGYRHEGLASIVLEVIYITPDGVLTDRWEPTKEELQEHYTALSFAAQDIGVRNDPVHGIHCTQLYCPHLAHCPSVTANTAEAVRSPQGLLAAENLVRANRTPIDTAPECDEDAGSVMAQVTAGKRALKYYEERVRKYADNGGRVIAGDYEFRKTNNGFRWTKKGT
jgi:hypothetical protein